MAAVYLRCRLTWLAVRGAALAVCLAASSVHAVTLTALVSFNGDNGWGPEADLIFSADGSLYGTTSGGGAIGYGTVFKLDPSTGTLTTLVSFDGANGSGPLASLLFGADGNLYGTTFRGGTYGSAIGGY